MKKYINSLLAFIFLISFIPILIFQDVINTNQPKLKIDKKELLGQINVSKHPKFTVITAPYSTKKGMYMNKEAYNAFKKMYTAASKEGINLNIVSAFRSFNRQKSIWEAKWTGARKVLGQDLSKKYPNPEKRAKAILMFSSMPGTSRHHWGTDVDIYSVEDEDFASGKGKKIYEWLVEHASEFGFCQVYTPKPEMRTRGYEEEKWHWSYKPVSQQFIEQYQKQIHYNDIVGFKGDRVAKQIGVIENYVLGINPNCF